VFFQKREQGKQAKKGFCSRRKLKFSPEGDQTLLARLDFVAVIVYNFVESKLRAKQMENEKFVGHLVLK
jgi:hypothetical protein